MSTSEKRLKDLLIPLSGYPHMPYWGTLREAIAQLNLAYENGYQTVLIFNEAEKGIGVLSQKDILRSLEPKPGGGNASSGSALWKDMMASGLQDRLTLPVEEAMSGIHAAGQAEDDILVAARLLSKENTDLLPVMENGKLIGVVLMEDLFQEITNAVLKL